MALDIALAAGVVAMTIVAVRIHAMRRKKPPIPAHVPIAPIGTLPHTDRAAEAEIDQRIERIHRRAKERSARLYDDLERLTTGLGGKE